MQLLYEHLTVLIIAINQDYSTQEISVLKIIFKGANGCLLFLKNCHTSNIPTYNVILLEHITFTSIQTNISKSSSDQVLARPA